MLSIGSTMRIPLLYRVSIAGTSSTKQPPLKDKSMWYNQEKKIQKIDRLARSLLIQGLLNDIYSLIDSNEIAKDLWDALARHMLGSEYGEQDRKAAVLYEYETIKATEGELLLDTYIRYLQYATMMRQNKNLMDINIDALYNILKKKQGDVNDVMGLKTKTVVVTSDPLALVAEKTKVSKRKEKVVVSLNSEGSDADDFNELKKITTLLCANKKQEYVKSDDKKVEKKDDEKKRDMSKVKCYNCKKEGHFARDCKNAKVKDYEYYKTKMLLAKKDKYEQVLLAEDHAWMESSSDSDQEIMLTWSSWHKLIKFFLTQRLAHRLLITRFLRYHITYPNLKVNLNLDTLSSVRRPKPSDVMWIKKGSSNTVKPDLSSVNHSNLNKNVKRYSRKNLMACNNSDTRSAHAYNSSRNALGCSKHMTGNRALLTNFMEKFFGMVRFGNNDFAVIPGYGDVVIGSMTINKVYYVEGLGHKIFSVGQFCDKGLEVTFRKSTCFVRTEDGVDLLTGDRSSYLYTIALNEIAPNFWNFLLTKASSLQSWLWHQRLSHLNFATINKLVKNNLVQGLPKMKFEKDHLCFACEQGKIHQKHHKSKTAFVSNQPLYLLHMDLCGSMRVESINGKRYVLVVVDDYSWYTWVFFLHSKDEASNVIISFIKNTQVNPQLQVQRVRTDNGTEFKNKTLTKFFDEAVKATRTMLTFANLPWFLWAEAIETACFIENRLIIHKRFDKTPYELMNKRKPNIKFFRVLGCRCYLLNDYDDVGKLKAKGDIEVFVGYSKESTAFRIYNKRTRKIQDNVNVNFDEISEMASKQFSLEPGLSNLNETRKYSNPLVSEVSETSKKDLEDLFQKIYDEYLYSSNIMKSSTTNVETSNIEIPSNEEEAFHESSESFQEDSSSSSMNDDV
nr:hypothetical protein [Tanacetum cinerariifolium]